MKKLNLGCGNDYREGWVNLDKNKKFKADIYSDIEKRLPFKSNTFDYIYSEHVLEHINNLIPLMRELRRISKNEAVIEIRVPHALSIAAYQDPTHVRFFTYQTFDYFTSKSLVDYGFPKFKIISRRLNFFVKEYTFLNKLLNPLINLSPKNYERIFGWILPCGEIICKLKVEK